MPDVAIIHAADKGTAATRLAEAIAAAGFAVGVVEIEDPAGLADSIDGCAADARILIWSRALVSHALHSGELARIRQLRGLIEVSADGITPPSRGDETRVVSLSGWRGQPFHPGWQRIHLELKRLCGSRKAPSEAAPLPAVPKNPKPGPARAAGPAGQGGAARPPASRLMLGGGAALLVAAAVGAANWVGRDTPDPAAPQEFRGARAPAIAKPPPSDPGTALQAPNASVAPPPAESPSPAPSGRPAAAIAQPETSRTRPAEPPAPSRSAARPNQRTSSPAAPVKKYSRKNSKVMREFCERSGRSTPQCRTFLRSIRERGGEAAD